MAATCARVLLLTLCLSGVLLAIEVPKGEPSSAEPGRPARNVKVIKRPVAPQQSRPRRAQPVPPAGDWLYRLFSGDAGDRGTALARNAAADQREPLVLLALTAVGEPGRAFGAPASAPYWATRARSPQPQPQPEPRDYTSPGEPSLETHFKTDMPSSELVALFKAQRPIEPELPPVVVRGARGTARDAPDAPAPSPAPESPPVCVLPAAGYAADVPPPPPYTHRATRSPQQSRPVFGNFVSEPFGGSPAAPSFSRSLAIRGRLTVPRASYTERYNASWHAPSGSMRVDFFDGATSVFRTVNASKIYRLEKTMDRTGATPVMRCAVMSQDPASASPLDLAPPALPNLQAFQFADFVEFEGTRAERWTHTLTGAAGELGGARGEALTFRHEALLTRGPGDAVIPLKYSVAVDSSVLGANSDGYVHRYEEVREQEPAEALLSAELAGCEALQSSAQLARVDPLREFTLPQRDARHDDELSSYMTNFKRQYQDVTEEAVRKNLLMQSTRFAAAGNRQGASFRLGATALSDRLDAEMRQLAGVAFAPERLPSEPFPYSRAQTRDAFDSLPDEFDWRTEGGVTPVRYQGKCSSCWAFAVTGAVEGALFRVTRRLVPLSEQAIVDCAHPFGGNGCKPTWPTAAYEYVKERGLPARGRYHAYEAKKLECEDRRVKPVTYISGHVNVTKHSIGALKVAIAQHSPTVVIIDMGQPSFKTYTGGVYYDSRCNRVKRIAHAVLAVGWSGANEDHLILKNSHSTLWGEEGFMRLSTRGSVCGALDKPSYPRLEAADVADLGQAA